MSDEIDPRGDEPAFAGLEPIKDAQMSPGVALGAVALNMAMKYHQMQMIPDGLTYQQYKMEGRNIREIGLVDVFETAMQIEVHLMGSSERIAAVIFDVISAPDDEEEIPQENPEEETE